MARKKLDYQELMTATEKLLLEQGYGGFNFSALSASISISRSTLYEYYPSKDELIADYMGNVMAKYMNELDEITKITDIKRQILELIKLMIKYTHLHSIIQIIPLLQSDSQAVTERKEKFRTEHQSILQTVVSMIEKGKADRLINSTIPTGIIASLLFNMMNEQSYMDMDKEQWAEWIWHIIFNGISRKSSAELE